tara:strand:+ start:2780 stop:6454 length:3675 start_codon:yes stop_codon:yes gene_type:complete
MSDSGNIFGKPFRSWVTKQIETRQESLGYKDYDIDDLKYQNTKTPWVRLASTVDINQFLTDGTTESRIYQQLLKNGLKPENFRGDIAAKNFILQGGAISLGQENELKTNSGLNTTNEYYNGAYGWGGLDERGYVPMPGIVDASIIYKSDGAFAEGTINMKCFSRSQLILMDVLYMRPGVNLLLEFGWSTYLDNEGNLQTYDTFLSDALDFTLNKAGIEVDEDENDCAIKDGSPQATILGLIEKERKTRNGNYEAMFGMITNFNWTFNPDDGSYTCQAKIIGHGDVIQGLAVNTSEPIAEITATAGFGFGVGIGMGFLPPNTNEETPKTDRDIPLDGNFGSNKLSTILISYYRKFKNANLKELEEDKSKRLFTDGMDSSLDAGLDDMGFKNYFRYNKGYLKYAHQDFLLPNFATIEEPNNGKLIIKKGVLGLFGTQSQYEGGEFNDGNGDSIEVYIKFSVLLAILQHNFLLYDKDGKPYFYFNMKFQNLKDDANYIANYPGQFSAIPYECIVPYQSIIPSAGDFTVKNTLLNRVATNASPDFLSDQGYAGKLSEVLLNISMLVNLAGSPAMQNKEGKISISSFLNAVLDKINTTRGGINNFKIVTDSASSTIKILDNTPIRWKTKFPPNSDGTELCVFNTFGVKNKIGGSIVKSIDIQSSISKDMADVIATNVGGGSNGYNVNGTGLNKWSEGITDRIFPDLSDAPGEKEPDTKLKTQYNENILCIGKVSSRFLNQYENFIFDKNISKDLKVANDSYVSLLSGIMTSNNFINTPYFLPFSYRMDLEGISGIRLYERFDLDNNVLPTTYDNESLEMQISSCDHTVSSTTWLTKIVAIPQPSTQDADFEEAGELDNFLSFDNTAFKEIKGLTLEDTDLFTITSQYPILQIFKDEVTEKRQVYLHHTVSSQNIENVLFDWSSRTDTVSTQYITNNLGESEQVFPDENWANQLGISGNLFKAAGLQYQNLNKTALGIELCSYGKVTKEGDKYFTTYGNEIPASDVAQPVNRFGKPTTYRGCQYFEKYNNTQINNVKSIMQGWISKYDIKFAYSYFELFPPSSGVSFKALSGEKGVFTHNSVRTDKEDVYPQKELIDMLKSISTELSDEDKVLSYNDLYQGFGEAMTDASALTKCKRDVYQQIIKDALGTEKAKNYRGAIPKLKVAEPDPIFAAAPVGSRYTRECTAFFTVEKNVYQGTIVNVDFTYSGDYSTSTGNSDFNITTINGQAQ